MRTLAVIMLGLLVCGCTEEAAVERPTPPPAVQAPRPFADAEVTQAIMAKWSRSCALCHVNAEGGAPRMGNADEWQARLAQGEATLLTHTIEGYNNMPPLGYCMACEREDLRALIKLMAGDA